MINANNQMQHDRAHRSEPTSRRAVAGRTISIWDGIQ